MPLVLVLGLALQLAWGLVLVLARTPPGPASQQQQGVPPRGRALGQQLGVQTPGQAVLGAARERLQQVLQQAPPAPRLQGLALLLAQQQQGRGHRLGLRVQLAPQGLRVPLALLLLLAALRGRCPQQLVLPLGQQGGLPLLQLVLRGPPLLLLQVLVPPPVRQDHRAVLRVSKVNSYANSVLTMQCTLQAGGRKSGCYDAKIQHPNNMWGLFITAVSIKTTAVSTNHFMAVSENAE